jgi:hypothetical protein
VIVIVDMKYYKLKLKLCSLPACALAHIAFLQLHKLIAVYEIGAQLL